jgi:hydroxyacylglutathione hydrolase
MNMPSNHPLTIVPIPAFADNYLWLIHNGKHAAVVDPGDATPVLAALDAHGLSLIAILLTHHHADHVGGVPSLLQHFKVPVYGPKNGSIRDITVPLTENDKTLIPELTLELSVLEVPGHTLDHIAYVAPDRGWLFCGDTMFAGGCGRLFEGTPEQMIDSLSKFAALPDATQVYCAHEYTLSNLRFAREVDPANRALRARVDFEQAKRDRNQPTLPSTIGLEKATNPFLRFREPAIIDSLRTAGRLAHADPVAAFAALREWKNSYR